MNHQEIRLGTRSSKLAMIQTQIVDEKLINMGIRTTITNVKSEGDLDRFSSLSKIGGKGVFVNDLNMMIIDGKLDCAIHSAKDLPSEIPDEIEISMAIQGRSYHDFIVSDVKFENIKIGGKIGTSSPRRAAEIKYIRPDLEIVDIRGNVETRIKKLKQMGLDGLILAEAGIERLELHAQGEILPEEIFIPSPGQGIIAVTSLKNSAVSSVLRKISEKWSMERLQAERDCMKILGAGCSLPFGILIIPEGNNFKYNLCASIRNTLKYFSGQTGEIRDIYEICRKINNEIGQ
ncbi:MAG: hydroxymethylbilane synthase [Thermoplasmataceae archaeon]